MSYSFIVGNLQFNVVLQPQIELDTQNTIDFNDSHCKSPLETTVEFHKKPTTIMVEKELFVADSLNEFFYQNIWKAYKTNGEYTYTIDYVNHPDFEQIVFTHHLKNGKIDVFLTPTKSNITTKINPFMHPLGILMISALVMNSNGFLIHASGINDNGNGYLFTGVSGIGKSTMAQIWLKSGAQIVNDDRLMIYKENEAYLFSNTPMPHYNDFAKQVPLKAIFLLTQSKDNYCNKITGTQALSKVMANFIQQLFDKDMVEKHIEKAIELVTQVRVYELGFKPDDDIVTLVRSLQL